MKYSFLLLIVLLNLTAKAQLNKIKGSLLGAPFESGFYLGTIGYERLTRSQTSSWQLYYNVAQGAVGADIGDTDRRWFTIEKTYYVKSKTKFMFFYTFFVEKGNRIKQPGHVDYPMNALLKNTRSKEICPGGAVGLNFRWRKKWGMQVLGGPKLIIEKATTNYYNAYTQKFFNSKANNTKLGGRFIGNFYFQF